MKIKSVSINITNKILFVAVLILFVAVLGVFAWEWGYPWGYDGFSAVYLRSGDLYFGKIVHFPSFGLKQVYMLRVDDTKNGSPVSIQQFEQAFWGPENFIKINSDNVIWIARLRPDSQLSAFITQNPALVPPQGALQGQGSSGTSPVQKGGK